MLMKLIYFYQFKIYKYLIIFQLNLILTHFYSKFKFVFILLNYHQKKSKKVNKSDKNQTLFTNFSIY